MLSYVNYIYPRNWCMHIIGIEHNVVIGTKRMEQYRDGGGKCLHNSLLQS